MKTTKQIWDEYNLRATDDWKTYNAKQWFSEEEIRKAIDKHINKHCYDCDIEEQTNNLLKELFGEK